METTLQAVNGLPRTTRRLVENVQRVAQPPSAGLPREAIALVVGGVKQEIEVERRPLPYGGVQAFWLCPRCGALRYHLFIVESTLACRVCHGLDYRSRHVLHPALTNAAKLRKHIGAAPGLLSKVPPRPPHWRRDYWARTVGELAAAERVIAELLGATLREAKRQSERMDGQ